MTPATSATGTTEFHPSNEDTWLEDRNGFTRYMRGPEESYWMCDICGTTDQDPMEEVDPYENVCSHCEAEGAEPDVIEWTEWRDFGEDEGCTEYL